MLLLDWQLKALSFSGYNWKLDGNCRNVSSTGGIAQLGERLHGMQEVIGSIPFTSTKFHEIMNW